MGRHGGGSRSGGSRSSSSSRSGSGSRSGGGRTSATTSTKPFKGCYNRSYYHKGKYHSYYTTDANFGKKPAFTLMKVFIAIFITMHMSIMVGSLLLTSISFGNKVDGKPERIGVVDTIDILTATEEEQTLRLLKDVYEKSGMPVTVFTDDFSWKEHYDSIEVYSEELYYAIGMDETAMVILFTQDNAGDFTDWEYDMYCGDDTVSCLSDAAFDKLLDAFQKAMAKQDLCYALDYSFTLVMGDLAKTTIKPQALPIVFFLLCFYGIFYVAIFGGNRDSKRAAKYFKEHPEKFENEPMTLYSECPSCGAQNTMKEENCPYCGTLLKLSDGNVTYVKP